MIRISRVSCVVILFFALCRAQAQSVTPLPFTTVPPCRMLDTRITGGSIVSGSTRDVTLTGSPCGIPASAAAVSANFALFNIIGAPGNGVLKVWPVGSPSAFQALINWSPTVGQIDNASIVPLGTGGAITLQPNQGAGSIDLVIDVNGYFGGSVVTDLTAGTGLAGGGTGSVSLGIASGGVGTAQLANLSVTQAKLSATGTSGQFLSTDGTNLLWQNGTGLTLPFSGSASTASPAFSATNNGTGYGIVGFSSSPSASGVYGSSNSPTGYGVVGVAAATSGVNSGVYGTSSSSVGAGVFGGAISTSGANIGVYGLSSSTVGTGVFGGASASSGTNWGVYGLSASTGGTGVLGVASSTTGANWGIYGLTSSAGGLAGYFSGNVQVTGTLSKGGGSFKIDHPLDPANKYLSHSFVESPDMKNIYDGVAVLDGFGEALIRMPDWFEALNRDFRYQLTAVGGTAPNLHIAEKLSNNRFKIAGGKPGLEISWQVTGIRKDAWANAYRIPVEQDKPSNERGYYLHPEIQGKPEEKGIDWAHHPEMMKKIKQAQETIGRTDSNP